jgi:hypothetical protein
LKKKRKTKKESEKVSTKQFQLFFRNNSKRIKCKVVCKERSFSIGLIVKIVPEVKS